MRAIRSRAGMAGLAGALALTGFAAEAAMHPEAFVRTRPDEVRWTPKPDSPGVEQAVLAGDPNGPGLYVVRVKFPPHVMDHPHWHPNERYVTVLKGIWWTGTGERFDPEHAVPLGPGGWMIHPARAVHWDGSRGDEEVIVQITGLGPAASTPVDPTRPFWVRVGG